jgi:hypothetical protein
MCLGDYFWAWLSIMWRKNVLTPFLEMLTMLEAQQMLQLFSQCAEMTYCD